MFFGVRTCKPVVAFIKIRGYFGGVGGLTPTRLGPRAAAPRSKTRGFNVTTTGFKFLLQETRETAFFGSNFTETVKKNKNGRFPIKTIGFWSEFP